ncbi:MAG TPA: Plug domain-containing protein [Gemmatimonadaceae bacterium]|nr:Plug domain-containing protein [Gemmatimonadaceae bacterium]
MTSVRLGVIAGAVLFSVLPAVPARSRAQVVVPPASERPIPPKTPPDTAAAPSDTVKRDTAKTGIGRLRTPATYDIGPQYRWDREEMFASGALTVTDLLARVPELVTFRSAWIASPQTVAHNGSFERVRFFYDGVELDPMDPRSGGLHDLAAIQIWTLEEIAIERAAGEVRVHMRSWRVDRTTPYTRTDVITGSEETDIYRGFYGKRFDGGQALQLAAQQSSTQNQVFGGGGGGLSLFGRVGIGRRLWSVDATANRTHFARDPQDAFTAGGIPPYDAMHTVAYLRGSLGAVGSGPWLELVAASHEIKESSPTITAAQIASRRFRADSADTTRSRTQLIATAGFNRWGASITLTERLRRYAGEAFNSFSGRAEVNARLASAGVFAEVDDERGMRRTDGNVRVTPLSFMALAGGISQETADGSRAVLPDSRSIRGEAGLRLLGPWVYAGLLRSDTVFTRAPAIYDTAYAPSGAASRTAQYAGVRGAIWRGIGADAFFTRWEADQDYLPEYHSHVEINFATKWLSRFPRGDFGLRSWIAYDYRPAVSFPTRSGTPEITIPSHVMSGLLEIRIMRAAITYQTRNMFGFEHDIVPGFLIRQVQIYGVRWDFWN